MTHFSRASFISILLANYEINWETIWLVPGHIWKGEGADKEYSFCLWRIRFLIKPVNLELSIYFS